MEEVESSGPPLYRVDLLPGRHKDPFPTYDILVDEGSERAVPHVCARAGEGYVIRVTNMSQRHIACHVTVDGENALLKDGSLIVAPHDKRELPGFLVSKNFVGKEYVKEYRDFIFGKPQVVEGGAAKAPEDPTMPYTTYGMVRCEVYQAVLDEEVDSDTELRGQSTFFRGAGLNGSYEDRRVPEGKKKHMLYSTVTVQGARSAISNSTRGRWWVRGPTKLRTLELRYREAHSLMLLGVDKKALGLTPCKEEGGNIKQESKKEEDLEEKKGRGDGLIEVCDLTAEEDHSEGVWTLGQAPPRAEAVDVVS